MERFVLGVDLFVETLWKVWTELLDVLGLDISNLSQYFSPASVANSPANSPACALLLLDIILLTYWFLSLTLGFTCSVLHLVFGRFWVVPVLLFSRSCVYILHKHEGERRHLAASMPRMARSRQLPLHWGWEEARDYDSKVFYIDHKARRTSWIDSPRQLLKPLSFADCVGDELLWGWVAGFDAQIGVYYINHINKTTQIEDPKKQWRGKQEKLLKDYLLVAQDALRTQKELYHVKQQRLALAVDD
ncbi:Protein WWC2 [Tupaia chinensis]|uniref:Protein WWC2 n=1 Tax=Tupaia chinensis TaxID=246437 RepID=L8Y673_TUPCH|nr:Protein WWC2 [Tupaia chinensis]